MPINFNLGPRPKSMTFDFDGETWVADGVPIEAGFVQMTADDLDINPMDVFEASGMTTTSERKREAAAEWLTHFLAETPKTKEEVRIAAVDDGISWSTLRRAADDVEVVKQGATGPGTASLWSLLLGQPSRSY